MPGVDIALVDKAHYARRKNPTAGGQAHPEYGDLYQAIQEALRPKARSLWLATATPMPLDAVEASDLLALTRRVGAFQDDPRLMQAYYETLCGLTGNRRLRASEWTFLQRAVLAVEAEDPSLWAFLQHTVIDGRTRLAVRQWLDQGRPPRPVDVSGVRRLIFAASPLSRVMLRHARPLLRSIASRGNSRTTWRGAISSRSRALCLPSKSVRPTSSWRPTVEAWRRRWHARAAPRAAAPWAFC